MLKTLTIGIGGSKITVDNCLMYSPRTNKHKCLKCTISELCKAFDNVLWTIHSRFASDDRRLRMSYGEEE